MKDVDLEALKREGWAKVIEAMRRDGAQVYRAPLTYPAGCPAKAKEVTIPGWLVMPGPPRAKSLP